MHVQPPQQRPGDRTMKVVYRSSSVHYFPIKGKKNRITSFLKKLNPANWFNDFRNIEITLEEFGPRAASSKPSATSYKEPVS